MPRCWTPAPPPDSYPLKHPGPGSPRHPCMCCWEASLSAATSHSSLTPAACTPSALASAFAPHGFSSWEGSLNNFPTTKFPFPSPANPRCWSGRTQHPDPKGKPRPTLTGNRWGPAEYSALCQEQPVCWTSQPRQFQTQKREIRGNMKLEGKVGTGFHSQVQWGQDVGKAWQILPVPNSGLSSLTLYIPNHILPEPLVQDRPFRYRPSCPNRLQSQKSWQVAGE